MQGEVFHGVENFFPQRGNVGLFFSIAWKNIRDFFHGVETFFPRRGKRVLRRGGERAAGSRPSRRVDRGGWKPPVPSGAVREQRHLAARPVWNRKGCGRLEAACPLEKTGAGGSRLSCLEREGLWAAGSRPSRRGREGSGGILPPVWFIRDGSGAGDGRVWGRGG